jgi:hypothetical protein
MHHIIVSFSASDGITPFIWVHHQCITSLHHSVHLIMSHHLFGCITNVSHHFIIQRIQWCCTIHSATSSMHCIIASFCASDDVTSFIQVHHQCITSLHCSVHLMVSHHSFGRICICICICISICSCICICRYVYMYVSICICVCTHYAICIHGEMGVSKHLQ